MNNHPTTRFRTVRFHTFHMIGAVLTFVFLWCGTVSAFAQKQPRETSLLSGTAAAQRVSHAENVQLRDDRSPAMITFQARAMRSQEFLGNIQGALGLSKNTAFEQKALKSDARGSKHYRFQQHYHGVPVEGSDIRVHEDAGYISSVNGRMLAEDLTIAAEPQLSEDAAFTAALQHIDMSRSEAYTETRLDDLGALMLHSRGYSFLPDSYRLTYRFDVYASNDALRAVRVYVDAATGEVVDTLSLIHNCFAHNGSPRGGDNARASVPRSNSTINAATNPVGTIAATGSGKSYYNGTVALSTELANGTYRLRGITPSGGRIETYNAQNQTSTVNAIDFTDPSNSFVTSAQQAGVSAHFGAEKTYEYYFKQFGRNSIDNKGMAMKSYAHFNPIPYSNAYWNGVAMHYGDGNMSTVLPFVSLDIVGHEFTHGVTGSEAGLIYYGESGALNESFSDIFGAMVEFDAQNGTGDWLLGEDIYPGGGFIRSMSNPNGGSQPDTYFGTYWYGGTSDNSGVHRNSGVQNYWFYLLCNGGSVTNDFGKTFMVPAIGRQKASKIAYETLTNYLTSSSDYFDARTQSETAAKALFGANSPEFIAVQTSWKAVGVDATQFTNTLAPVAQSAINVATTSFTARWSKVGTSTGYQLDVSTVNTFASFVAGYQSRSVTATQLNQAVSGLQAATTYYYRVRAVNIYGISPHSNIITVMTTSNTTTTTPTVTLTAPSIGVNNNVGSTQFGMVWGAVQGATGYFLDVALNNTFTQFAAGYGNRTVGNVTSYTVTGLTPTTTYYVRLRASNGNVVSSYSKVVNVVMGNNTSSTLAAPVFTLVSGKTTTGFQFQWQPVVGAASYRVDIATDAAFTHIITNNVTALTTSYIATGLTPGTLYYCRVRAVSASNAIGANSLGLMITTLPLAPTALPATAISQTSFTAQWTAIAGADGYKVEVSPNSSFSPLIATYEYNATPPAPTSFTFTNLPVAQMGSKYYYRVQARKNGAPSAYSAYSNVIAVQLLAQTAVLVGSPQGFTVSSKGTTATLAVAANIAWTASVNQSWVKLNTSSGTGNGTLTFSVQANPTTIARQAVLALSGSGKLDNIIITQAASSGITSGGDDSSEEIHGFGTTTAETKAVSIQTYPNPFTDRVSVNFTTQESETVTLKMYNILGVEVASLLTSTVLPTGAHSFEWDAANQAAGTYFYRLNIGQRTYTDKVILAK